MLRPVGIFGGSWVIGRVWVDNSHEEDTYKSVHPLQTELYGADFKVYSHAGSCKSQQ